MLKGRSGSYALKFSNIISFIVTLSLLYQTEACKTNGKLTEEIDNLLFPREDYEANDSNGVLPFVDPTSQFEASNCQPLFVQSSNIFLFHGDDCSSVPKKLDNTVDETTKFSIKWTNIQVLTNNSFSSWIGIKHLDISENAVMDTLASGCFNGLHDLERLSITDNKKLKTLEEETFASLVSLMELSLAGNNFLRIYDATKGVKALTVPSLNRLDLSNNPFDSMQEEDFDTISQLNLKSLVLKDVELKTISPKSLNSLTSLTDLQLGSKSPSRNYIDLLKTVNDNKNLTALSLYNVDLFDNTDTLVKILTHHSYKSITFKGVRVNKFDIDETITVQRLEHLEISDSFVKEFPFIFFNSKIFPSLNKIIMKRNKSFFQYPQPKSTVKLIDLSYNEIGVLPYGSFSFTPLLEVLVLREAVHAIRNYAFADNKQLVFLDLSHNDLEQDSSSEFNKYTFFGLENLEALDLSFSNIKTFGSKDVFKYLTNLRFLSLRSNLIKHFDVALVEPLTCLTKLDLRRNNFLTLDSSLIQERTLTDLGMFSKVYKVDVKLKELLNQMANIDRDSMYGNCTHLEIILRNRKNQIFNLSIEAISKSNVQHLCRITVPTYYPHYDETTLSPSIGNKSTDNDTVDIYITEQDEFNFFYILFRPIYVYDSLSYNAISIIRFFYVFSFYLILFCVVIFITVKAVAWLSHCNKRKHKGLIFDEKIDYCGIENKAYTVPYEKMKQDKSP